MMNDKRHTHDSNDTDDTDDTDDTGLPASFEMAWGLRDRPHKGPKRGLSLEQIVEAGIKVAISEGIGAVSMSRVAAELGASTMSLYRYVASKDELLALMIDMAGGLPPAAQAPDERWRSLLSRWAWALLAAYRRHPWILRIPVSAPPITPNQIAWMEQGLSSLYDTGLTESEKLSVVILLSGFVRDEATLAANVTSAILASGSTEQETMSAYGRQLMKVAEARHFSAIQALFAAGVFDAPDAPDEQFVFGLNCILDGIEALITARTIAK